MSEDTISFKRHHSHYIGIPNVSRYYALQAHNGVIFRIAMLQNGEVILNATHNHVRLERTYNNIEGIHGMRGGTLYLRDTHNYIHKARVVGNLIISRSSLIIPPLSIHPVHPLAQIMNPAIFHLKTGPFRAFREGNKLRIMGIECNPSTSTTPGLLIEYLNEDMEKHLSGHSVVHRGSLLIFISGDDQMCRKVGENVIQVESPTLKIIGPNIPITSFVYAQDHNDLVYMIVPTCKVILIIDPASLQITDNRLLFDTDENMELLWPHMNLIGVSNNVVRLGIPSFAFNTTAKISNVKSYTTWMGTLRNTENKHYLSTSSLKSSTSCEENNGSSLVSRKNSELSASNWNVDVPEFVPLKTSKEFCPQNAIADDKLLPQSETKLEKECARLKEENCRLKRAVGQKKEKATNNRQTQTEEMNDMEGLREEIRKLEQRLNQEEWKVATLRLQMSRSDSKD